MIKNMRLTPIYYIASLAFLMIGCSKDSKEDEIDIPNPVLKQYFIDVDKDNYGNPDQALSKMAETKPDGYAENGLDCDDENELINPIADDYAYDGLDFNCDGTNEVLVSSFSKTFGGSDLDGAQSVVETTDGSYLIVGYTSSMDGDVTEINGDQDVWVTKVDNTGELLWEKNYGGSSSDEASLIFETNSGDFFILGTTRSNDGDITSNNSDDNLTDYWMLRIDTDGNLLWQETLGGSLAEYPTGIVETADGHFAIIGSSESPDGDVTDNQGDLDIWFSKINASGSLVTSVTFGGSSIDRAEGFIEDQNGNFIISATTYSIDGDLTEVNSDTSGSNWIFKIDKDGVILNSNAYGGDQSDNGSEIINTSDGGYLVGGQSSSNSNGISTNGSSDVWIMKFSENNQIMWQMNFGGSRNDYTFGLLEIENGYMVLSAVFSGDLDIERNYGTGNLEPILLNLDLNGNIKWQKNYGGSSSDRIKTIIHASDGGYSMVGTTGSNNYDIKDLKGRTDAWFLKLDPDFNLSPNQ